METGSWAGRAGPFALVRVDCSGDRRPGSAGSRHKIPVRFKGDLGLCASLGLDFRAETARNPANSEQ